MFPGQIIVDNIIMGGNPNEYMTALGTTLDLQAPTEDICQWLRTYTCLAWAYLFRKDENDPRWDQFFDLAAITFSSENGPDELYGWMDNLCRSSMGQEAALLYLLKSAFTEDILRIAQEKSNNLLHAICLLAEEILGEIKASPLHSKITIPSTYPIPSIYAQSIVSGNNFEEYDDASMKLAFNIQSTNEIITSFDKISEAIKKNYGSTQNIGQVSSRPLQEIIYIKHKNETGLKTHLHLSLDENISESTFDNYFRSTPLAFILRYGEQPPVLDKLEASSIARPIARLDDSDKLLALTEARGIKTNHLSRIYAELNKRNISNIYTIATCALSENICIDQGIEIASLTGINSFEDALNISSVSAVNITPSNIETTAFDFTP